MTDVASLVLAKLNDQVDRTRHLISLIPPQQLDWKPGFSDPATAASMGELLGHLLDCLAGFCAGFYTLYPVRLAHFAALRDLQVNHRCEPEEASQRVGHYMKHIEEGFAQLNADDLVCSIPTAFTQSGAPFLSVLLDNLEHFINHKFQLFLYLKLLGVSVQTADLYRMTKPAPKVRTAGVFGL